MGTLVLGATIETATIPELPLFSSFGPLTTDDHFIVRLAAFNITCKIDGQSMYDFMQNAGGGILPPVVLGDKFIHVVTAGEAGGTIVNIPELANKTFFLERDGYPLMVTTEFNMLGAGGFQITIPGDVLVEGQRFVLSVYELQGGTTVSTSTPFIKGVVNVSSNLTFDTVNHLNKLIQIRGDTTKVTFTLPQIADIPEHLIIPIEAIINNTVEQTITTQAGQFIYINNESKTSIRMRAGEVLWLYRGADGYYIINDFAKVYIELAKPQAAYKIGLNELLCNGQLLNRADYPRLWEYIQTLGASLVTDAVWSTVSVVVDTRTVLKPYRGCFSTGDGSLTFRLPDLMGMTLTGLISDTGTDPQRHLNKSGGFQDSVVGEHSHTLPFLENDSAGGGQGNTVYAGTDNGATAQGDATYNKTGTVNAGLKNTVENIGVLWVIKC